MRVRSQLPVHSPLTGSALFGAAAEIAWGGGASLAEVRSRVVRELGAKDVVLLDSGTSALRLAITAAVGGRRGAPVALPAFGCYDLATAVVGAGSRAILYDVDPRTLAPDLDGVRSALARGAGVLVCASLYGFPTDTARCAALARSAGATLVVDAAQANGASESGGPYAAQGSLSVLSFGRGKGRTGGAGGALVAMDDAGAAKVAGLDRGGDGRAGWGGWGGWGRALAQWTLARPTWYGLLASVPGLRLGETVFHPPRPPRPMSAASAAVLARVWDAAAADEAARRVNARRLLDRLDGHPVLRVPRPAADDAVVGYLRLPVLAGPGAMEIARGPGARALGILPSYPICLADLPPLIPALENAGERFPGARQLARSLHTLPTHGLLGTRDLLALEAWIRLAPRRHGNGADPLSGAEEELEAEVGG